jgi:hypothetical protein
MQISAESERPILTKNPSSVERPKWGMGWSGTVIESLGITTALHHGKVLRKGNLKERF